MHERELVGERERLRPEHFLQPPPGSRRFDARIARDHMQRVPRRSRCRRSRRRGIVFSGRVVHAVTGERGELEPGVPASRRRAIRSRAATARASRTGCDSPSVPASALDRRRLSTSASIARVLPEALGLDVQADSMTGMADGYFSCSSRSTSATRRGEPLNGSFGHCPPRQMRFAFGAAPSTRGMRPRRTPPRARAGTRSPQTPPIRCRAGRAHARVQARIIAGSRRILVHALDAIQPGATALTRTAPIRARPSREVEHPARARPSAIPASPSTCRR